MKYCFKYVFKRPDSATVCLDEIDHYLSSRVLSAGEAAWRLLGLPLHQEFPPIMRLDIHLPHQHRVTFNSAASPEGLAAAIARQTSTLLQWFTLNRDDPTARVLKYVDIPGAFTWRSNRWHQRKNVSRCLGRIFMVGSETSELFFLRRLLGVVRGAQGFDDLLTFDGVIFPNFQAACAGRGMLIDDAEFVAAMSDVISVETSVEAVQQFFVNLVVRCRPSNSHDLFIMFLPDISGVAEPQMEDIECTMWALEGYANDLGTSLSVSGWALPALRMVMRPDEDNMTIHIHNRDVAFASFSPEQLAAAEAVLDAVAAGVGGVIYLTAAGGCGKSFWANGVSAAVLVAGGVPVIVAASAMAASVLHGGRTAHASFRIPLECSEGSFCSLDSELRAQMRAADIVIWDECSMVHTVRLTPPASRLKPAAPRLPLLSPQASRWHCLPLHVLYRAPHASRLTPHASRLTPHASSLTPHASSLAPQAPHLQVTSRHTIRM
jgi:PIF1-like helicase